MNLALHSNLTNHFFYCQLNKVATVQVSKFVTALWQAVISQSV